jgi:hypothetical protein
MNDKVDFVAIATPLVERGFRVTPVHPETKMGVMKNWQKFQLTTIDDIRKYAEYFPHHNIGVVGKRGVGRHCFLDVDALGVAERIENDTKQTMPKGYRVKSSPKSKPYKTHFYFKQTPYSFEKFGGWEAVNSNVKDMTTFDEEGKHPTLYDLKGVGGGSLVVGAGSVKQTCEVYTCVDDGPVPEIPNWLVDWLVKDIEKYWDAVDAEKAAKLALKEAEQKKYTPDERVQMRRKNLPEGFDIYFEDRYEYLYKRSRVQLEVNFPYANRFTRAAPYAQSAMRFPSSFLGVHRSLFARCKPAGRYKPEELFDSHGTLIPELQELAPSGTRRISANPHANGGLLRKELDLPDFRNYAVKLKEPGATYAPPTDVLAHFLAEVMRRNMSLFRVFGPDETASNRLTAIYAASKKTWVAEYKPEDADGGELDIFGRVMEMLSEHTLEGWFEGYVLTGRHGFFSTYEAFVHVIDSMFNQHAKWLEKSKKELDWRAPVPSINILITSLVWRQDHNGFTHQDPGFLDVVTNKSRDIVRIYLPPDANCLLSVADHCLRSRDYVNVIVADKQDHLQYLTMEDAVTHCTKGIGIWDWASTDDGADSDVVLACAGDIATMESLAAVAILKTHFADLKIRFVNVVDLFRVMPESEHPHGLSDRDFDSLFTTDKPVIFNFHSYASLIHKLSYRRTNHDNIHVRGYKEKGNVNTPLELAILNQVDRFDLAIDVIDRVPRLRPIGAHVKEWLKDQIIDSINYAHAEGIDKDEIRNWKWPG